MTNFSDAKVPMTCDPRLNLSLDKLDVDVKPYQSKIIYLLHLIASQPDIMFYICNCARYQANPREAHLTTVKRYLLIQTLSNADFGGCQLDCVMYPSPLT